MCGRFTLTTRYSELVAHFQLEIDLRGAAAHYRPRYNIAPTSSHWIALGEGRQPRLARARWGLPGRFGPSANHPVGHINARSETAADKPSFRDAFLDGRCCVLADGFFEWQAQAPRAPRPEREPMQLSFLAPEIDPPRTPATRAPRGKTVRQPYWFHRPVREPMLFAGLYRTVNNEQGEPTRRFTILTCAANDTVAPFHQRMPAILSRRSLAAWLAPVDPTGQRSRAHDERDTLCTALSALLRPAPRDHLIATPVSLRTNNARHDDPRCIEAVTLDASC